MRNQLVHSADHASLSGRCRLVTGNHALALKTLWAAAESARPITSATRSFGPSDEAPLTMEGRNRCLAPFPVPSSESEFRGAV
mgnify:CR=1 FL=1